MTYDFQVEQRPMTPGDAVCDFCSSPAPKWGYPCRDHETGTVEVPNHHLKLTHGSRGAWAACEACHTFIQRADRDGLEQHSASRFPRKMRRSVSPQVLLNSVRQAHDQFWANREGGTPWLIPLYVAQDSGLPVVGWAQAPGIDPASVVVGLGIDSVHLRPLEDRVQLIPSGARYTVLSPLTTKLESGGSEDFAGGPKTPQEGDDQ